MASPMPPRLLSVIAEILMPGRRQDSAIAKFLGTCVKFFSLSDSTTNHQVQSGQCLRMSLIRDRTVSTVRRLPSKSRSLRFGCEAHSLTDVMERRPMTSPTNNDNGNKIIYWHRELPPFEAEAMGEHTVEATSSHVLGSLSHRDEQWARCHDELMAQTRDRLYKEVARLGGDYAHVLQELIDTRHNEATGEAWLHGRFTYMLFRRPTGGDRATSSSSPKDSARPPA
jgi:hypothetical protein